MIFFKCRPHSIHTVHFRNQLSVTLSRSSFCANQDQAKGDNSQNRTSRLGALMPESESTQYSNYAHLTHLFCSVALKISANNGFLSEAKQLHSHVIKLGYYKALSMQNQILHAYVKCGEFWNVDKVFDEMPVRNIVSWNTVITGAISCSIQLGFHYFGKMLLEMVLPDSTTMNALLRALIMFNNLGIGRQLHGFAMKIGLSLDRFVGSAIVDLYGKLGLVRASRCAFNEIQSKDLVVWNVMVSVYVMNRSIEEAFGVFRSMQLEGVQGDDFTFTSLLNSCSLCGCLQLGKQFQGLVTKLSFDLDIQVASVLVDMYAKNGCVIDARKVFDGIVGRNLVTWNTMIVGYGKHGFRKEAMKLLIEMFRRNVSPDEITVASIVSSCGNLSATGEITEIHAYAIKTGFEARLSVANALIVAYSNSGSHESASQCANSVTEPDLVTWTSILSSHAFHGHIEESIKIFNRMLLHGIKPDNIAFLEILSACSHGGLVREGLYYLKMMVTEYNIAPSSDHYSCLVDLLGRVGLVDEAFRVLNSRPVAIESNTLGALVGASKAHGHVELAEWGVRKLFELEQNNPVNYILMSNVYSSVGQWDNAARVRKMMKNKCDSKKPGCSWIEIAGNVHTFLCNDTSHVLAEEVYYMLGILIRVMKEDD